jgi:hypothetical protein
VSESDLGIMLRHAADLVNAGRLDEGRALLEKVLEKDPRNDQAWVWLSGCVEEPHQRRICLQQALRANPNNQAALDGMKVLDGELVQVTSAGPSLLETRLAAIGMSNKETAHPSFPVDALETPAFVTSTDSDLHSEAPDYVRPDDSTPEPPQRRRPLLILVAVLFILVACVCVMAALSYGYTTGMLDLSSLGIL